MIDEIGEFLVKMNYIPDKSFVDAYYDLIYFTKYLILKGKSNIDRLINCADEEFEHVFIEEVKNRNLDNLVNPDTLKFLGNSMFKKNHKEIFEFINKKVNLKDYDKDFGSSGKDNNKYIDSIIDWKNTNNILSIFEAYYSDKKRTETNVEVIYSNYNTVAFEAFRNEICGYCNYSYNNTEAYPIDLVYSKNYYKKYDFVYCNLVWNEDLLNSHGISSQTYDIVDDNDKRDFVGDNFYENINYLKYLINDNGKAVLRIQYSYVSKLPSKLVDNNIIEEIVFMPKIKEWDEDFTTQYTNIIYIVISNNKNNENIILTDYIEKKKISVPNNVIKAYGGLINIEYYKKNDPKGYKIYNLKEDNKEQLKNIVDESNKIDKLLDEFDLK